MQLALLYHGRLMEGNTANQKKSNWLHLRDFLCNRAANGEQDAHSTPRELASGVEIVVAETISNSSSHPAQKMF